MNGKLKYALHCQQRAVIENHIFDSIPALCRYVSDIQLELLHSSDRKYVFGIAACC